MCPTPERAGYLVVHQVLCEIYAGPALAYPRFSVSTLSCERLRVAVTAFRIQDSLANDKQPLMPPGPPSFAPGSEPDRLPPFDVSKCRPVCGHSYAV
jgi:hypothetical protein